MVTKILSPIVIGYVLNKSHGHWLVKVVLHFIITKTRELCDEVVNVVVPKRMGDHEVNVFDTKLEEHIVHMKHQVLEVFQPFLSFLHGFKRKKRSQICWLSC